MAGTMACLEVDSPSMCRYRPGDALSFPCLFSTVCLSTDAGQETGVCVVTVCSHVECCLFVGAALCDGGQSCAAVSVSPAGQDVRREVVREVRLKNVCVWGAGVYVCLFDVDIQQFPHFSF